MIIYKLYDNKIKNLNKPINIKINISHKDDIISKYKLKLQGNKKLYCINDIEIISDTIKTQFYKVYDKSIVKENDLLSPSLKDLSNLISSYSSLISYL